MLDVWRHNWKCSLHPRKRQINSLWWQPIQWRHYLSVGQSVGLRFLLVFFFNCHETMFFLNVVNDVHMICKRKRMMSWNRNRYDVIMHGIYLLSKSKAPPTFFSRSSSWQSRSWPATSIFLVGWDWAKPSNTGTALAVPCPTSRTIPEICRYNALKG